MHPKIPEHIKRTFGSTRKYKEAKRRQIREALKSLEELRMGCAFMKYNGIQVREAIEQLEQAKEDHSVENWGR